MKHSFIPKRIWAATGGDGRLSGEMSRSVGTGAEEAAAREVGSQREPPDPSGHLSKQYV